MSYCVGLTSSDFQDCKLRSNAVDAIIINDPLAGFLGGENRAGLGKYIIQALVNAAAGIGKAADCCKCYGYERAHHQIAECRE